MTNSPVISTASAVYVAFDPGRSTGVAKFDAEGSLVGHGTCRGDEDLDAELWLIEMQDPPVEVFIIEKYRIFSSKIAQHVGKSVETEQVIGNIKRTARRIKAKIVMQEPNIKGIAAKWSGIKYSGDHANSHVWDAVNHGIYYLTKIGILKARVLIETAAAAKDNLEGTLKLKEALKKDPDGPKRG